MEEESSISSKRYTYYRESKLPLEAIDRHHITVRRSSVKALFLCSFAVILLSNALYISLVKEISSSFILSTVFLTVVLVKLAGGKLVMKESVVVMPAFGVQLETHYRSGRIVRRFVPFSKILKPVLQECVTPVTCYWNLSLILREEPELMLVFKELRPPVRMLVPIWKALCDANGSTESSDAFTEDAQSC